MTATIVTLLPTLRATFTTGRDKGQLAVCMTCSLGTAFASTSFAWRQIFAYYRFVTALSNPPYQPCCHLLLGTLHAPPANALLQSSLVGQQVLQRRPRSALKELFHAEAVTVKLL